MSVSKKSLKINNYQLKGSLRRCGFIRWRYVFNGTSVKNGEERTFFIEVVAVNPALSAEKVVIKNSNAQKIDENNLQASLVSVVQNEEEPDVMPSFCSLASGIFGQKPKQLVRCFPNNEFSADKKAFNLRIGGCTFSDSELFGIQTITKAEADMASVLSSDYGRMEWNLKYERLFDSKPIVSQNNSQWFPSGINTAYSGSVSVDGDEYIVMPDTCFGYADKSWGAEMVEPFLHISSSRFTSIITGSGLAHSAISVEGDFDGKAVLLAKFGNDEYSFGKGRKISKFISKWRCVKVPSESGIEELHWSVSFNSKKYVLDIDVLCPASEMIVKDYAIPSGGGSALRVLSGGDAAGEVRLYRYVKKSLELIHHVRMRSVLAEFGLKDKF